MRYPVMRSALCLGILAMCFFAFQCTADTPGHNNDNAVASENGVGTSGAKRPVGAALSHILNFFAVVVRKATNATKKKDNDLVPDSTSDSPSISTPIGVDAGQRQEAQTEQLTTTTTTAKNIASDNNVLVGTENRGSSSSPSSAISTVDVDTEGSHNSDVSHSSSGSNKALGSRQNQAANTTKDNAGTHDTPDVTQTKNGPGDTSVKIGEEQNVLQTTTTKQTDITTTSSQTTASATSVQTVMSTSTTAPKDSTQKSATFITESAKGDSIATEKSLRKIPNALQSVEYKDENVGFSSVFALSALVTLAVMAIAPSF